MAVKRTFCVTVYVFNKEISKCLLIKHRALNKWFPPGGKIEDTELPENAAIRECLEETGIPIKLFGLRAPIPGALITPYGVQTYNVVPGKIDYIDLIYAAFAETDTLPTVNLAESLGAAWFDLADITQPEFDTFDSVKYWVKELAQQAANF